jgi:hypothetical protein
LLMLPVCSRLWLLSTRVTYAGRVPVLVSGRWQAFFAEHPDLPPSHHSLSRLIPRPTPSAARGRGHRASRRTSRELVADGDASGAGLAGPMERAAALLAGMVASASAGADYRIRPLPAHGHELGVFGQVGGRAGGGLPCQPRSATRRAAAPTSERIWSTFGPHAIGTERFATVSSGASFAQVADKVSPCPDQSRHHQGVRCSGR